MDTIPPFDAGGAPHGFQGFRALKVACGYAEERPVTDSNIPVFRAQLRYQSVDEFIEGYSQFVLPDKMFIPLEEAQLKPVDSRVRFEFKLADGSRAMVGEGVVRQVRGANQGTGPTGLVVEYTHLSRRSKQLVGQIVDWKRARARANGPDDSSLEKTSPARDEADQKTSAAPQNDTGRGTSPSSPQSPEEPPPAEQTSEGPPPDIPDNPDVDDEEPSAEPEQIETAEGEDLVDESESPAIPDEQAPYDDFDNLDNVSDAYGREPQQVGETEGGLQIMAYDDMSEEDAEEFAEFALGSDEDDVDQMFDDVLSGGSGGGDDLFGGGGEADMFDDGGGEADMFDGSGGTADRSDDGGMADEMFDDSGGEAGMFDDGGNEVDNAELGEISSAIDNELDKDETQEVNSDSLEAESFSDVDPAVPSDSSADQAPPAEASAENRSDPNLERQSNSGLSDLSEEMADSGASDLDFESEEEATIEADTDPNQLTDGDIGSGTSETPTGRTSNADATSQFSGFGPDREDESDELDEALDSLEEESDDDRELSLSLGNSDEDKSDRPDDSLEALVADEQQNLQESDEHNGGDKDALDEVLGDDTPPPPSDDFEFDISRKGPEVGDSEQRGSEKSDTPGNEQNEEKT